MIELKELDEWGGVVGFRRFWQEAIKVGCTVARVLELEIEDPSISRLHACLQRNAAAAWVVVDMGSAQGTWLNGVRVRVADLHDGDELRFGERRYRVRLGRLG